MSEILQQLSDPRLPAALEANLAEEMTIFGRARPDAQLHTDPEFLWFVSGKPHFNGVLLTHLAKHDTVYVTAKILEKIDYFQTRQLSFSWSVGSSTHPANLATHLEAHGFKYHDQSLGLALDLHTLLPDTSPPAGLVITEITDLETLKIKRTIEQEGFDASPDLAQDYYDGYAATGFGQGTRWHHYLGWLNGEAVAMSSLLLHAGVAGIYGVATLPKARRQGLGTAMTLYALYTARNLNYHIAILTDTAMSAGIYRRMGFQHYSTVRHYGWSTNHE